MQRVSAAGLAEVKEWESFVPFVYDDLEPVRGVKFGYRPWDGRKPKGTLTIGYGHTDAAKHPLKCRLGATITEAQASEILDVDLDECENDVRRLVKVELTQGQFDALVSFQFNSGALGRSTLLRKLNSGAYDAIPDELMKFVNSKGRRLTGLVRRRQAEIKLWNTPGPTPDAGDVEEKDVPVEAARPVEPPEPKPTVAPDPTGVPKPLGKSKSLWGAGVAFVSELARQAADISQELAQLVDSVPGLKPALVVLTLLGIGWAIYGRIDVRREHGV